MSYSDFSPTVRSLPYSPVNERYKIFAFDLLFFLSKDSKTNWAPYGWLHYFIDPLSPWTSDFEDAARIILRNIGERHFIDKYQELVSCGTVDHLHLFLNHSRALLQNCFSRQMMADELFRTMLYVGKLAILFYQYGVYLAPDYAVVGIGETLRHYMKFYGPGIFVAFRVYACHVINDLSIP